MAQQMVDLKLLSPSAGNCSLPADGKQIPVAVKKTPLRDLQNENNALASKSTGSFAFTKEGEASIESTRVSGTKRPCVETQAHNSHHKSPGGNSVNGHLVYVRRKSETEASKNNTNENCDCSKPKQIISQLVTAREQSHVQEARMPCLASFAPTPSTSLTIFSSGQHLVPLPLGKPVTESVAAESHSHPGASSVSTLDQIKMNKQNWEERYFQLQMFLKKLEQSGLEEYIKKLQALTPAELNRHAVELEKRTIQLSLEEGVELQRVRALDVLGKGKESGQSTKGSAGAAPGARVDCK